MSNHIPPSPPDSLAETSDVSRDDLFEALANSRRRIVLSNIADAGAPVELRALARSVAREEAPDDAKVSEETFERVSLSLYHTHLPKLDHLGLIEFDSRRRVAESAIDGIESLPS